MCECHAGANFAHVLRFNVWQQKQAAFDKRALTPGMQATASQAYAERIFCASGLLSSQEMNCMEKITGDKDVYESECWATERHWLSVILYRVTTEEYSMQ